MKGTGPDLDRLARTEDATQPFILTFSAPETTSCAPTAAGAHEPAPYPERVSAIPSRRAPGYARLSGVEPFANKTAGHGGRVRGRSIVAYPALLP